MAYTYDRGEHRTKHCGNQEQACFAGEGKYAIGKCPRSITDAEAQRILETAIPEPDPFQQPGQPAATHPKRLYGVYKGVIYEAAPTTLGRSYHGYPWMRRPGRVALPRHILEELRRRAVAYGYSKQFDDWYDQYG